MAPTTPWLKIFALGLLVLAAAWLLLREAAELPSLDDRTRSAALPDTGGTRLGQAAVPATTAHPGLSGAYLLPEPREAFAARILLARAAERSIDAQYYIWHKDLTGSLLFDELRAAAGRGVRVRLLLDDNNTPGLDRTLAALDADRNIEVRLFNPFVIRKPRLVNFLVDFFRLNRRMHNKSFTVDNQATIIGGRNIGDEYFGASDGALFADLDALAVGPVAQAVSGDFDAYWASASAYPVDRIVPDFGSEELAEAVAQLASAARHPEARQYLDAIRNLPFVAQLLEGRLPLTWAPVRMISDDPAKALGRAGPGELMISELEDILEGPKERLNLVSAYFVPTHVGTGVFTGLAARNVEVDILTNSLAATDVPVVHAGYAKHRKALLKAGVRLWEIRGTAGAAGPSREITGIGSTGGSVSGSGTALHAKTFTADGLRLFVGSFNFDPRSALLNTELGFVIRSAELTQTMDKGLAAILPTAAYEVRLTEAGALYWIERGNGAEIRHDTEPGTNAWQRLLVATLSLLPIDWLL